MPLYRNLLILVITCLMAAESVAAEYRVTPSLRLRGSYDDNVFFKEVDDFEFRATTGQAVRVQQETAQLELSGDVDVSKYARHDELDTVDQAYRLSSSVFLNPLLRIDLAGQYVDDHTFRSALDESGLIAERSGRKRFHVTPGVTVSLDQRNSLALNSEFEKTEYRFEGYSDYWMLGGRGAWIFQLVERQTNLVFTAGGFLVDFDEEVGTLRQFTYGGLAGIEHRVTESLRITLNGGLRYTKSEGTDYDGTSRQNNSGFIGNASMDWEGERMTFSAGVARDIAPSIASELIIRDKAHAFLKYRFTEKLSGRLDGTVFRSKTQIDNRERRTFSAKPTLVYAFRDEVNLQLGYRYTLTDKQTTNRTKDRNRIFLQVEMTWPQDY